VYGTVWYVVLHYFFSQKRASHVNTLDVVRETGENCLKFTFVSEVNGRIISIWYGLLAVYIDIRHFTGRQCLIVYYTSIGNAIVP